MRWLSLLLALLGSAAVTGCGDALRDERIEALGPEVEGVAPGPFHRPGQPCTWCHSDYGGAAPKLAVGGTVYYQPSDANKTAFPVDGYIVELEDARGVIMKPQTNCIGNFYVEYTEGWPYFPLRASLLAAQGMGGSAKVASMSTRINREGSCAGCHQAQKSASSPGPVVVPGKDDQFKAPGAGCEGVP
ncbi:MAG: hypothetical protein HY744_05450 [Deltaproteobacteria bacterium]|nr:hypothetical protein [Deltaproteobacteria bacterium]